jgi:protein-disulfide isomerase
MFAAVGVAAIALVGGLIAVQAAGGSSSSKVPERVTTGDGRVLGDANAPVTVVEYADFQCPVCKRAETSVVSRIEQDYVQSGKVKIEFRMFPFLGQESFNAAQAADAAGEQGKFWEYRDALFNAQGQENSGTFTYEKLVALAKDVGLDVPRFEATLTANTYVSSIQGEVDAARQAGVSSTPTFFVGDTKIVGAQPYATFQSAIDAALAKAGQ